MAPIDPRMNLRRVRECGECTFCCHSMPIEPAEDAEADLKPMLPFMVQIGMITQRDIRKSIPDFFKPGDCDCPHERKGHGCAIYNRRPLGCRLWSCMWALDNLAPEFERPDKAGYAVDPNMVEGRFSPREGAPETKFDCIMIWCDWTRIDELKNDPKLRSLMRQFALRGYPTMLRAGNVTDGKCVVIFPPPLGDPELDGLTSRWTERASPAWATKEEVRANVQAGSHRAGFI